MNENVKELVLDIKKVTLNEGKDIYLYVASKLLDLDYDNLFKRYTTWEVGVVRLRDYIKLLASGHTEYLDVEFTFDNRKIILRHLIADKFTVSNIDGDIDPYSIFGYLFGYLGICRFIEDKF